MKGDPVLALDDARASRSELTGAKAANLAIAARAGLVTLPGFVVTTEGVRRGLDDPEVGDAVAAAFAPLDHGAVVVRSSSTIEDAGQESMAGRFTSVLGVCGWAEFVAAFDRVVASAAHVPGPDGEPAPMAVLVQRQLSPRCSGVMFGCDPLSGRRDRVVVEVVAGGPDVLVSGRAVAAQYLLSRRGRILRHTPSPGAPTLATGERRRLARLAGAAERRFGRPQDIEWAIETSERLVLLQTRPITATGDTDRLGPVLGAGPVSETFPDRLTPLEQDLWLTPLREGIMRALVATGAVSRRQLSHSPVVAAVDGYAVVDLDLFGLTGHHIGLRARMGPTRIARRLVAAWRVGRLRAGLPELCHVVIDEIDGHLERIHTLDRYRDDELVELLERARRELATAHCLEVLTGMLLADPSKVEPAALVAIDALQRGRADGTSDADLVLASPVVLSLSAPSTGRRTELPELPPSRVIGGRDAGAIDRLAVRDAVRLRCRWLQELLARAAVERCRRLAAGRTDRSLDDVLAGITWEAMRTGTVVGESARSKVSATGALPVSFRLDRGGNVVVVGPVSGSALTGRPASAGRAVGVVRHRVSMPMPADTVLVTRHLDPGLASSLPALVGLVAETGSALSHLAILARELGVPTVAGVDAALSRLPNGTRVVVDGTAGTVEVLES